MKSRLLPTRLGIGLPIFLDLRFGKLVFRSLTCFILLQAGMAYADSGTWIRNPADNNWNNPANWSSNSVPGVFDTASFDASNVTDIAIPENHAVGNISFEPNAAAFTVTALSKVVFELFGEIANNSSVEQNFVSIADASGSGSFQLDDGVIAGPVAFTQQATNVEGGFAPRVLFIMSKAGAATFHNLGASVAGGQGGRTDFWYTGFFSGAKHDCE